MQKSIVYHTVVWLTVIKQQISFVVGPFWGSLTVTPKLSEAAINRIIVSIGAILFLQLSSFSQWYIQ